MWSKLCVLSMYIISVLNNLILAVELWIFRIPSSINRFFISMYAEKLISTWTNGEQLKQLF